MSTNPSQIHLNEAQREFIAAESERMGRDWEQVLASYVPSKPLPSAGTENALEVAKRLGLVGSCESGLGDLATNPIHLEGFGQDGMGTNAG